MWNPTAQVAGSSGVGKLTAFNKEGEALYLMPMFNFWCHKG